MTSAGRRQIINGYPWWLPVNGILLFMMISVNAARAQDEGQPQPGAATLVVELTQPVNSEPIRGVVVEIVPENISGASTDDLWPRRETTGASNRATFPGLPLGRYRITTRPEGFAAEDFGVTLSSDRPVLATLPLTLATVTQLEDVTVEAGRLQAELERSGFYRRARSVNGMHYDRDAFLESNPRQLTDFLSWAPYVRISYTEAGPAAQKSGFRSCNYSVWIDGILMVSNNQAGGRFDIDTIPVENIAGVEIYDKMREAPAEFRVGGCVVILIWRLVSN